MANANDPISGGLVSLEGLTKPATVLIEKISDAIGTLYHPRQIVREARAEAEAEKIRALADLEITEIQQRGIVRFIEQQGKQQQNFENVVAQAIPELQEEAKPDEIDSDWMTRFFEASKLVSDKEMQTLWARLLAGEANAVGTFSKSTIERVSNLEKLDAQLFTQLCTFVWYMGKDFAVPLVHDPYDSIYEKQNIVFSTLAHLEDIGLIKFDHGGGFRQLELPKVHTVFYHGTPICVEFPKPDNNTLDLGKVVLTRVGRQLAPISGSVPTLPFLEYVLNNWVKTGYNVWSPLSDPRLQGKQY